MESLTAAQTAEIKDKLSLIFDKIESCKKVKSLKIKNQLFEGYRDKKNMLINIPFDFIEGHNFEDEILKFRDTQRKKATIKKIIKKSIKMSVKRYAPELNEIFLKKEVIKTPYVSCSVTVSQHFLNNYTLEELKEIFNRNK